MFWILEFTMSQFVYEFRERERLVSVRTKQTSGLLISD